jgi:membrane protein implicated in regulation of membrane protease activity
MNSNGNTHPSHTEVGPIAGEGIKDAARWPGFVLIAVGLVAFALGLAALATGRQAAGIAGIAVFAVACALGVLWQYLEHRRVARRASTATPERPEDTTAL